MMNIYLRLGAAGALVLASPAALFAQQATPAGPVALAPVAVKMGVLVPLKTTTELNSKTTKTGERFPLTVAQDVLVDKQVVIPAGSPAVGEVMRVVKKGAFGRSGKIEARVLYADVGTQRIVLTGQVDSAGKGNTTGTVAAAVAVGVFSAFVTGKSAVMPVGFEVQGYTAGDSSIAPPRPVAEEPIVAATN